MADDYFFNLPIRLDPALQAQNYQAARDWQIEYQRELSALQAEVDRLDREISEVNETMRLLEIRRRSVAGTPGHLPLGLSSIIVLTVGGIVLPLYFLGRRTSFSETYGTWIVISAFIVGMILVFGYVYLLLLDSRSFADELPPGIPSDGRNTDHDTQVGSGQR